MAAPAIKNTNDCTAAMTDAIAHDGWEHTVGVTRSFYIRGATWFKNNVLIDITNVREYLTQMAAVAAETPDWRISGFRWDEKFSPRQAIDGLSLKNRKPLKFYKAVQTLELCEAVAEARTTSGEISISRDEVYNKMRIEPGVFYIRDFNHQKLAELKKERPNIQDELREECAQTSSVVFADMAGGSCVTRRLAEKSREFIA